MNRAITLIGLLILMGWCVFEGTLWNPPPLQASSRHTENTPVVTIPFEFVKGHILVTADVNNFGLRTFYLDTGANSNWLTARAAREMGIQFRPATINRYAHGLGESKAEVFVARDIWLRIQGTQVFSGKLPVIDMDWLDKALGCPIDGCLGFPLFASFVVEVDYANHRLKLYDPCTYEYRGKGQSIPIHVSGYPFVKARLVLPNGTVANVTLQVDTGSDRALGLNHAFCLKNGLPGTQATIPHESVGVGGSYRASLGFIRALQIEQTEIEKPSTLFSEATRGFSTSGKFDGTIGNAILKRFTVIFDYSRKRMIWEQIGR